MNTMTMTKTNLLIQLAQEFAAPLNGFVDALGPGVGNQRTNAFVAQLRRQAADLFNQDYSEHRFCDDSSSRFDYYFRDERTVIEVALGLPNPNTEFEKDILKVLVARDFNHPIDKLVFISRKGAKAKCEQPGRGAIIVWAKKHHRLDIKIVELEGQPRKRNRVSRDAIISTPAR